MPHVNDDGRVHQSFILFFPGDPSVPDARFWPYDGGPIRKTLTKAINIIQKNIVGKIVTCNRYFTALPGVGGPPRTFDDIWNDPLFYINFDPRPTVNFRAVSSLDPAHPMEITISPVAFRQSEWNVAATIVHEMAHLNGAPVAPSNAAERALPKCGLGKLFDPSAVGNSRDYADLEGIRYT